MSGKNPYLRRKILKVFYELIKRYSSVTNLILFHRIHLCKRFLIPRGYKNRIVSKPLCPFVLF